MRLRTSALNVVEGINLRLYVNGVDSRAGAKVLPQWQRFLSDVMHLSRRHYCVWMIYNTYLLVVNKTGCGMRLSNIGPKKYTKKRQIASGGRSASAGVNPDWGRGNSTSIVCHLPPLPRFLRVRYNYPVAMDTVRILSMKPHRSTQVYRQSKFSLVGGEYECGRYLGSGTYGACQHRQYELC